MLVQKLPKKVLWFSNLHVPPIVPKHYWSLELGEKKTTVGRYPGG